MQSFTFKVYDAAIAFSTNSQKLAKEICKDFGRFEIPAGFEADGSMTIVETDDRFSLEIPRYAIRETFLPPDSSVFSVQNLRFLEEKGERVLRVDLEKNEILGYFKSACKFTMFLRFLLKWLLIKGLEKKDVAFIHGSSVERDGSSLLFVGPSGHGKTHTLITLLLEGYRLITDDTILFRGDKILPFHMRSRIDTEMAARFPVLKKKLENECTYFPGLGWLIDLGHIFPSHDKEIQASNLFYVYVWNASETKVEVISKKEMLARLLHAYEVELGQTLWSSHRKGGAMRDVFPNYSELVKQADCYKIYAGTDPSFFLKAIRMI